MLLPILEEDFIELIRATRQNRVVWTEKKPTRLEADYVFAKVGDPVKLVLLKEGIDKYRLTFLGEESQGGVYSENHKSLRDFGRFLFGDDLKGAPHS